MIWTFGRSPVPVRGNEPASIFLQSSPVCLTIVGYFLPTSLPMVDRRCCGVTSPPSPLLPLPLLRFDAAASSRSEEHTSELQSQSNLVCRLLLEKKKKKKKNNTMTEQHKMQISTCNAHR